MNPSEIKILVVDDDADILNGTARLLENAGYAVDRATDGAEALQAVHHNRPDLVLTDRDLPELDGIEVCRRIKQDPALADICVVIASASYTESDEQAAGLEAGADGYIARPITNRELLARVESYVRILRLTRSLRLQAEALKAGSQAANEAQRASLNLMEDAVAARDRLEAANLELGGEITERKQVEEKLRELSIAVEQSPVSIVITDPAGNIEYVNPKFIAVTGYSEAEVLGRNPRVLKSGELSPEGYRNLWQTITAGKEWRGEFHNKKKNGELFWESASISPIRDLDGRISHYVAVKEDISARKQAEEERGRMEGQLQQAQKLESIGQLAAGIAHEINTPTQYIGDNTRFLQDSFASITQVLGRYDRLLQATRQQQVTPELVAATAAAVEAADIAYLMEEVPKSICQTLEGVAHVAKIVRAMKDFSHPGSEAKTPTDLNHAVESTVTVAHNEWKYVADLDLVLDPQLPLVPCLPGEINQVILNLVINAAHAIGDVVGDGAGGKGRICVSTSQDWVEIRVQDTGTGITEAARARVFDPFFTTKAVGKGTGQGLAIAHSVVVKQHGGTIRFETELGKGTTFIVRLPLHPGPSAQERNG